MKDSLCMSLLFTVRVSQEEIGDGETEWRGKVQHELSRTTQYFRDWSMLSLCVVALLENLSDLESSENKK